MPALEIEAWVGSIVESALSDRTEIATAAIQAGWDGEAIDGLLGWPTETNLSDRFTCVERVILHPDRMTATISFQGTEMLRIEKTVPMIMRRRGREQRIVIPGKPDPSVRQDQKMIRALRLGLRFWEQLKSDLALTGMAFAEQEGTDSAFLRIRLSI